MTGIKSESVNGPSILWLIVLMNAFSKCDLNHGVTGEGFCERVFQGFKTEF